MSDDKVEIVDDNEQRKQEQKEIQVEPKLSIENTDEKAFVNVYNQDLLCDNCALRPFDENLPARCQYYKSGNTCYYKSVKISSGTDIAVMFNKVMEISFNRFFKAVLLEKMDGGVLDKAVSDELRRLGELLETYKRLTSKGDPDEIFIKAKGKGGTSVLGDLLKDVLK